MKIMTIHSVKDHTELGWAEGGAKLKLEAEFRNT